MLPCTFPPSKVIELAFTNEAQNATAVALYGRKTDMPVLLSALWMCFGVAVGILSGFLGVGGGVVLTPLLLYLGYSPKVATATALAFVIPTAWASIMKGREYVDVTLAVLLAVGAVVGAYAIGQPLVQSPHLEWTYCSGCPRRSWHRWRGSEGVCYIPRRRSRFFHKIASFSSWVRL